MNALVIQEQTLMAFQIFLQLLSESERALHDGENITRISNMFLNFRKIRTLPSNGPNFAAQMDIAIVASMENRVMTAFESYYKWLYPSLPDHKKLHQYIEIFLIARS
jgi:hypothetical protein